MFVVFGAAVFVLAWCLTPNAGGSALDRLRDNDGRARPLSRFTRLSVDDPRQRSLTCAAAGTALGWVIGGWALALGGLAAGLALSWWIGRLESPATVRAKEEISRDLPLAADLLAACATVGRPVEESLQLVSASVGGALAVRLDAIMARLALGADPLAEWRRAGADPQLASLGRAMARTLESGAPLVDGLTRLAEDRRRERRTQTQLRARNVAVKAAGPLAACFLPAFMLIGVVPTIAGGFSNLVL
ncbi:MAG: type II secretion system F family protein [Propionibacteriales bacterium]|nr:type II secretion system F family protein [Propionibacteriales bacterium]